MIGIQNDQEKLIQMRTQIQVNEWYWIHNITYRSVNVKIKIKSYQKFKIDITYKIEVKAITINNNENTTDWKGKES